MKTLRVGLEWLFEPQHISHFQGVAELTAPLLHDVELGDERPCL